MSDRELNSVELDDQLEHTKAAPAQQNRQAGPEQDSDFLSWLNLRMKSADWENYERGSDEFLSIDLDLEKLSKSNPEMATQLWKENTPPGMRLPLYLEAEQLKAVSLGKDPEASSPARVVDPEMQEGDKIPDALKRRYLSADGKFFFRDQKNLLAFEDRGRKLVTEHNDPDVAKSVVELAEAKGWNKIKVAGHEDFKREVWLQATLKGIEVTGYKPKEVDLTKLQELQGARAKNSVERDDGREVAAKRPGKELEQEERAYASPAQTKADNFKGKLLEHGRAPYDFDKENQGSYFVKIETPNGTRMHWGIDLERAVGHSGVKIGETIELERMGKRAVEVDEKIRDKDGNVTHTERVQTERIEWKVQGLEASKLLTKVPEIAAQVAEMKAVEVVKAPSSKRSKVATIESPEKAPKGQEAGTKEVESQKTPSKKRTKAPALDLSEVAKPIEVVKAPSNEDTKAQKRKAPEMAPGLGLGAVTDRPLIPKLTGSYKVVSTVLDRTLKASGLDVEARIKVQAAVDDKLRKMAEKGEPAPGVKIYDRTASRERPREKIVSKSKEQQQERSR